MSNSAKRKSTYSEDCGPSKLRMYIVPQGVHKEPVTSSTNATCLSTTMRPRFQKVLRKGATHTAECCRLVFPIRFVEVNYISLDKHVTMADSTGHRLWHMRMQECRNGPLRVISNGWREFCYDHSLKENDALVFTLLSFSHFLVEFGSSESTRTTCSMYPTREDGKYPWITNGFRIECLSWRPSSANSHYKKTEKVIQTRSTERKPGGHGITTLPLHHYHHPHVNALMIPPEFTYLVCKNPNGSDYFQILDSDDENEIAASDNEDEVKRSEGRIKGQGAAQTCKRICSEARNNKLVVSQTAEV